MSHMLTRRSAICFALASGVGTLSDIPLSRKAAASTDNEARWWKEAVVYQVYPRSFQDTNGDGMGDLPGLISRLDHIQALGATVVWLCPHYDTPDIDNGYDIRDYRKVNPDLGTMADFERLVSELHQRGMRLIVDLVVNHTSDEHEWFRQSRSSRNNPYRDFYIWRDGRDGGPPNNYPSFFGGSAWQLDAPTGQYYLHYFARKQPDLNWENPKVRQHVYDIMRFWLDKGVSGFRMDVIPYISKPDEMPDLSPEALILPEYAYANGPHVHDYLQEMNREVLAGHHLLTVGEAGGVTFEQTPLYVGSDRHELDMIFHFDLAHLGRVDWKMQPWTIPQLKSMVIQEDQSGGPHGWSATFLENHDHPRSVSRYGDDRPQGRIQSAKALAVLLLMRRGTPYIYQGEEIGMTNIPFSSIADFEDINAHGIWKTTVESGAMDATEVLPDLRRTSRDNARTPMQWDASENGGFTTGKPWFRVNPNHTEINVAHQKHDPQSVLTFYRHLIALRANHRTLIYGAFQDVDPSHPAVFAFTRTDQNERFLILINLTGEPQNYVLPITARITDVLLTSTSNPQSPLPAELPAWHAGIYRIEA
ncbi:glycoside hydrolase family 13 protein [Gluconobacter wancherniae]|uniref:glycoside hydrolase family 13 protein n=1 Tax=Gluconobacter wancherniae TaxID=1307955 RepID=UPI002011F5E3|nr:alpha-glucosidase [Gluconobacter wancherniae]